MMRSGGGHAKGANWERYCCKRLSLWVTKGRREDIFWRTAMSGGRATFQLRRDVLNLAQSGDMMAIAIEGLALCEKHLFEMKHHHDLNFIAMITGRGGKLVGFWWQTQQAGERYGKLPVLIAKQDRYPPVVITSRDCPLFYPYEPWAIFPDYDATLYDFERVTTVPRIKRPRGRDETAAGKAGDDRRPVVHLRHQADGGAAP